MPDLLRESVESCEVASVATFSYNKNLFISDVTANN